MFHPLYLTAPLYLTCVCFRFMLLYVLYMAVFVLIGSVIGLHAFTLNSYGERALH